MDGGWQILDRECVDGHICVESHCTLTCGQSSDCPPDPIFKQPMCESIAILRIQNEVNDMDNKMEEKNSSMLFQNQTYIKHLP